MSFWNKVFDYMCGYKYLFNEREHINENVVHTVDVEEHLDTRNQDSSVSISVELEPSSQVPNSKLPHIGVVCTFLASLLFAISNLILKKLKYPAPKLQFYKFITSNISMAPFFICTICYRRTNAFKIPSKSPYLIALLLIQGVVGACLATFIPCGVEYFSIPDPSFIVSGLPMFINFFVFIFTVEKNFGKVFCLTIGLVIGGIGCLYEVEGLCCSEALSKALS
ncbi:unnamed protein product [Orchesella dallaii]|uniref:WAT1-related protein n=1 Tax=Orchesella dallaii TaxID=48710 RepID=A0ABP1SAU1_9HEXA